VGVKAFVEKLTCAMARFVKGSVLILLFTEENLVIKQYIIKRCIKYARGPSLLDYT
jgi:hypothetical protein